ncbi:hypothetical protein P692DRAFT_20873085 [Suillus brevipes Sb2]|nr:hypothetical protein P692DRAFT_20873085 [Suillus brevipes Sb2]
MRWRSGFKLLTPIYSRHHLLYIDMTQQKPEMPSGVDQQPSPGPSYMGSSPASFDYVEEQFGGGRRYEAPPAELTPSRLRTRLKATVRDVDIVKDASARRQAYQNTSNDVQLSRYVIAYAERGLQSAQLTLSSTTRSCTTAGFVLRPYGPAVSLDAAKPIW